MRMEAEALDLIRGAKVLALYSEELEAKKEDFLPSVCALFRVIMELNPSTM